MVYIIISRDRMRQKVRKELIMHKQIKNDNILAIIWLQKIGWMKKEILEDCWKQWIIVKMDGVMQYFASFLS